MVNHVKKKGEPIEVELCSLFHRKKIYAKEHEKENEKENEKKTSKSPNLDELPSQRKKDVLACRTPWVTNKKKPWSRNHL